MIGANWQLVTNEPMEFEKWPVEVQNCRRITDHYRGIYRIYPNLIKENRRMSTCNWLDLQTLGSQPVMPKNLPDHCLEACIYVSRCHMTCRNLILHCTHEEEQGSSSVIKLDQLG